MLSHLPAVLMPLDLLAVVLLLLAWAGTGHFCEHPPAHRPSVSWLMKEHRRAWMREMVSRSPRIFDASVIDSLRRGTAFFASGSMIAIGGGMALIGNQDRLETLVEDLTLPTDTVRLELRVILVLFIVANAFLKFVWAHRVFGYCAILMAAVPNAPEDPRAYPLAAQAAEVNINAARNFNSGLRAVFHQRGHPPAGGRPAATRPSRTERMSGAPSSSRRVPPLVGAITGASLSPLAMVSSNSRGADGPTAITAFCSPCASR